MPPPASYDFNAAFGIRFTVTNRARKAEPFMPAPVPARGRAPGTKSEEGPSGDHAVQVSLPRGRRLADSGAVR